MDNAMTLDEAKLILSDEDLSYLSISELSSAMRVLKSTPDNSEAEEILLAVEEKLRKKDIRDKKKNIYAMIRDNATFREYEDAKMVLDYSWHPEIDSNGKEIEVFYHHELRERCQTKVLKYIGRHTVIRTFNKNALGGMSWSELAEVKAMIGNLRDLNISSTKGVQEFVADFNQKIKDNFLQLEKMTGLTPFAASEEKMDFSGYDVRDFEALEEFKSDMNPELAKAIEQTSLDYAKEYDVLNGLDDFDAKIVNQNAVALHRVLGTNSLADISKASDMGNLFKSIQIPELDENQEIAKEEDGKEKICTEEKKQEYLESLFESARAQVLKDSFNNPLFFRMTRDEQQSFIQKEISTQISTDVLTMYVASGLNDGVSKILQEKLGIEEPADAQKVNGSEAQFAYNQKLSGELSQAFADPNKMTEVMDAFNDYMETIASADGKIRINPHQLLANQADKQAELKDFRKRLQTLYKKEQAPAAGAIVARRYENKLRTTGEKVYGGRVYNFAVGIKDFAKNNTGKAMEIAGTLGISAGSLSLSAASIFQGAGWFEEGAKQFLGGSIGTTLASAMVVHTAAKSLLYPVVSEWKAMANDKEFANKNIFAKYFAARAEAKKKDPDLNLNLYIAGAAVVTTVAGGFLMGPMGSRMAAAATIAVGNYIIKRRDYNRTKKLYEQTGDEKYRIALYGNKGSEDIQNATGLKKVWKQAMNWMGAKKNQKRIAMVGAVASIFGLGSRAMAAEHVGALGGVKASSSTLENVHEGNSLGVKAPTDSLSVKAPTDSLGVKAPADSLGLKTPADSLGVKAPTDSLSVKAPTDSLGVKAPADSLGVKAPADSLGLKTPADSLGVKAPADSLGLKTPADSLGVKAPADSLGLKTPADSLGVKAPADSLGVKAPADSLGLKTPADSLGFKTPADSLGFKTPADSLGVKAPADSLGLKTPADSLGLKTPTGQVPDGETPAAGETPVATTEVKIPAYNEEMGISKKQFNTLLSTRTEAEITKMYSNLTDDVMQKNFPNMTREQLLYKYNRLDAWTARVKSDGNGNLVPLLDKAGNPVARYQMDAEMKTLKKIIECGESVDEKNLKSATAGLGHIKTDGDTDLSGQRTSNRITSLQDKGCGEDNHAFGKGGNAPAAKVNAETPVIERKEMPVLKMAGLPVQPDMLPTHLEPLNLAEPIAVPTAADHSYLYVPAAYGRELLVQGAFDAKGAPVLSGDAVLDARTVWASPIDTDKPKGNIQLTRYFNGEFIGKGSDVVKAKDLGQVIGVFDDANKAGEVVLEGKAKIAVVNVATGNTSVEKINLNAKGMPETFTRDMASAETIAADAGKKVNKITAAAFAAKSGKGH